MWFYGVDSYCEKYFRGISDWMCLFFLFFVIVLDKLDVLGELDVLGDLDILLFLRRRLLYSIFIVCL